MLYLYLLKLDCSACFV